MKKYNIEKATLEFKNNANNAVAFTYANPEFSEGPLNGKTITIKDAFATKDAPTQSSSKILEGFEPQYDATIVNKLRQSGGAIIGKTHLDELALGGTGTYSAFGIIKNPLDSERHVGGSSSGAAATLTENVAIAIGSDTGDSVRIPASFVGKVGFKPSYGAVSRFGLFAYASSLDTVGWLTHDVATSIDAAKVLFGSDEKDMTSKNVSIENTEMQKPKKVAFLNVEKWCKDYVSTEYAKLINKFKEAGVEVEMIDVDERLLNAVTPVYRLISYSEASSNYSNLTGVAFGSRIEGENWEETMMKTRSEGFGSMVQRRFTLGSFYLDKNNQVEYFERAQKIRRLIVEMQKEWHKNNDLVIFPSTGEIANRFDEERLDNFMSGILTSTNLSGFPSITLPWEKHDGMPFGIQLEKSLYEDETLLAYASWVEKLIGGSHE
ncbi:amidase family protein [Mycoplasma todarodis]|uniref:amidase family protein n=1 Tax=Mycoplasma todarodis TaxID=1937191 RepID=UPI003B374584